LTRACQTVFMTPSALILIVEDEPHIAQVLELYLRRDGFRTEHASNGKMALEMHRLAQPDLLLLDIGLPEIDGLEVLRRIRNHANTPVIFLTAKAEDLDKLLGLSLGADDYVVKPFNPQEVLARVKAVLRRAAALAPIPNVLRLASLEVDTVAVVAKVHQQRLDLTLTEFRLLETLMRAPNKTFSRSSLFEAVLPESDALERVIDMHFSNLRKKLEKAGEKHLLETVRGVGYRLWVG
jgi:two-component system, OmpR family, response regulator AdeR